MWTKILLIVSFMSLIPFNWKCEIHLRLCDQSLELAILKLPHQTNLKTVFIIKHIFTCIESWCL